MLGPCATLAEDRLNVAQGLTDLRDKARRQVALTIPANHATGYHEAALSGDAIGVTLGRRPAVRLQYARPLAVRCRRHADCGPICHVHRLSSIFRGTFTRRPIPKSGRLEPSALKQIASTSRCGF